MANRSLHRMSAELLQRLRSLMKNQAVVGEPINAYIIPTDDAHQSEYPAECDRRREFISKFTGSAGTAIVTENKAALWTDGRYFIQANDQLDPDNWTLMKDGLRETPSQDEWLCKELPSGSRVGVDAWVITGEQWKSLSETLELDGISLVAVCRNLVDEVWSEKRPAFPTQPAVVHPMEYAGRTWQDKIAALRSKMSDKRVGCVVVTALDDVAWLFNIRGRDIPHVPVVFAYAVVTLDSVLLYMNQSKITEEVRSHLTDSDCPVELLEYAEVTASLKDLAKNIPQKVWISGRSSQALHSCIPKEKQYVEFIPVAEMKAVKNDVEIAGMRNAHIKDAAALCEYFAWLEQEVPKGTVSEVSGANKLDTEFRAQHKDFVEISFDTISSVGSNGAIIHYCPSPATDKQLTTTEIYLCDSGAQYRDGTTDVTRTMHFGTPSAYEKECFTRVLKGHINLERTKFPTNIKGQQLDSFARIHLWNVGLNYLHGTGHGVGQFLAVHEGPVSINRRYIPGETVLEPNCILSNEPGYYEADRFGIRIESLVVVKPTETKYSKNGYLTFEPITFVPIQTKMIEKSLLDASEIEWVDNYHRQCHEKVAPLLKELGKAEALAWLERETRPIRAD